MTRSCLYLVSSSANREYVADCLEALALPRGLIHHFRYRRGYVDPDLWKQLPDQAGPMPDALSGMTVVVVYVFQEQSGGAWTQRDYLPVRLGSLIEAFRDGGVAHFYFAVTDYVSQLKDARGYPVPRLITPNDFSFVRKSDGRPNFAHLDRDLNIAAPPQYGDSLAFQDFVDVTPTATQWRTRSLGSAPLDVTYDPIFFRVAGIFHDRGGNLTELPASLRRLPGNPVAEYQLEAGQTYYIRVMTHLFVRLPAQFPGQGSARLSLNFDRTLFRAAGRTSFPLSSPYDLEHLTFQPFAIAEDRHTLLTVTCQHRSKPDLENFVRREVLSADVLLPAVLRGTRNGTGR